MLDELKGKGLIIHHWDTDGICSARLLLEKLSNKKVDNRTPILGNYFLTEKELEFYSKYDFIIIVDMSLPEHNIKKLAEKSKVLIFDHHLGPEIKEVFHHNPVIQGESPDEYPSASWIINKFLGNDVNLFALLGIIGDHEQRIKNNKQIYKIITDFCQKNKISIDDMLKAVYLLDCNYKLGDKKAVEKAPSLLLTYKSVNDFLKNKKWNKNLAILNQEIKKQIEKPSNEIQGKILKKINTKYNIISTVTRKIAWDSEKDTIVINTGFFDDKDQIYVRSNKNLEPLIEQCKSLGYRCGGKKEVFGIVLPKNKTEFFLEKILDFLK